MSPANEHPQADADARCKALRNLLATLPEWSQERERKGFVESALGTHPATANLIWGDDGYTVAINLAKQVMSRADVLIDGRHPAYALLAEVRYRHGDNPALQPLVDRLIQTLAAPAPPPPAACPYPGLLAYDWGRDPERARLFFGREEETAALVERLAALAAGDLLVVSGASGSGKSSLVKAGLWRALHDPQPGQETGIDGSRDWVISAMTPRQFTDPFEGLIDGVRHCPRRSVLVPSLEAARLRANPDRFGPVFGQLLGRVLEGRPAWLLILDQLEELFTLVPEPDRTLFIRFLLAAVADPRLRLVATIRSDYLRHLNDHLDLCPVLNRQPPYFVATPRPEALRAIIEGPARAVGLRLAPDLSARLQRDAQGESGGLALLGAVLQDLFDQFGGRARRPALG